MHIFAHFVHFGYSHFEAQVMETFRLIVECIEFNSIPISCELQRAGRKDYF